MSLILILFVVYILKVRTMFLRGLKLTSKHMLLVVFVLLTCQNK